MQHNAYMHFACHVSRQPRTKVRRQSWLGRKCMRTSMYKTCQHAVVCILRKPADLPGTQSRSGGHGTTDIYKGPGSRSMQNIRTGDTKYRLNGAARRTGPDRGSPIGDPSRSGGEVHFEHEPKPVALTLGHPYLILWNNRSRQVASRNSQKQASIYIGAFHLSRHMDR